METEQDEKITYDLDFIELEEYYNRIKKLFNRKNEMVNDFYNNYDYDSSLYIDFILTNKICDMLK